MMLYIKFDFKWSSAFWEEGKNVKWQTNRQKTIFYDKNFKLSKAKNVFNVTSGSNSLE